MTTIIEIAAGVWGLIAFVFCLGLARAASHPMPTPTPAEQSLPGPMEASPEVSHAGEAADRSLAAAQFSHFGAGLK